MSDTPRTDAAAIRCACSTYVVPSEFARELERENAALRAILRDIRSNNWDGFELAARIAALKAAIDAARKEAQP